MSSILETFSLILAVTVGLWTVHEFTQAAAAVQLPSFDSHP